MSAKPKSVRLSPEGLAAWLDAEIRAVHRFYGRKAHDPALGLAELEALLAMVRRAGQPPIKVTIPRRASPKPKPPPPPRPRRSRVYAAPTT